MNTKPINFRTKTQSKPKSVSLSQQFVKIQKVLTDYEKKKFHPKIQNFHYMSTNMFGKNSNKKKFLLKKDKEPISSEKIFGPLPQAFQQSKSFIKTQKFYDISQITLASSEQKQTYVKMSRIRNPEKHRRLKQAYPKYSERYISTINKNLIQLLGKQVQYLNSASSRQIDQSDDKQFEEFKKQRNLFETKTQAIVEPPCKKYAEIEIDEFLEDNTNLTTSQKRRITESKRRDDKQLSPCNSFTRKRVNKKKSQKDLILIKDIQRIDSFKGLKAQTFLFQNEMDQDEGLHYSNKGWMISQNNESSMMTL